MVEMHPPTMTEASQCFTHGCPRLSLRIGSSIAYINVKTSGQHIEREGRQTANNSGGDSELNQNMNSTLNLIFSAVQSFSPSFPSLRMAFILASLRVHD